jgi:hypothetical protein
MFMVKKILSGAGLLLLVFITSLQARAQALPDSAQLKTVKGVTVSFSSLIQKAPLTLVCFWSINSESSINELNAINAHYEKWKQGAAFTLLAVSVDEGVAVGRLHGIANMNSWAFGVYADFKGDLAQALGAGNLPKSLILRNGQVLYQQSGFESGSENYLFTKIQSFGEGLHKK